MSTDYAKRSINDLCRLYGIAEVGLETSVFRETRQALYVEIRAIIDEAKRRDEKFASLDVEIKRLHDTNSVAVAEVERLSNALIQVGNTLFSRNGIRFHCRPATYRQLVDACMTINSALRLIGHEE